MSDVKLAISPARTPALVNSGTPAKDQPVQANDEARFSTSCISHFHEQVPAGRDGRIVRTTVVKQVGSIR